MLASEDEVRAVTEVTRRLTGLFPEVEAAVVEHVVYRSYERFAGSPIRDFVPVLVERLARGALSGTRVGPGSSLVEPG